MLMSFSLKRMTRAHHVAVMTLDNPDSEKDEPGRRTSDRAARPGGAPSACRGLSEVLRRCAGRRAQPAFLLPVPSPERRGAPPRRLGGRRVSGVRHAVLVL